MKKVNLFYGNVGILVDIYGNVDYNQDITSNVSNKMALTEQQRLQRQNGIGGSDCAAVLGLSKWRTPYDIYMDKILEPREQEENRFIEWGNRLESVIVKAFEDKTGFKCSTDPDTTYHPEHPFMFANIDAKIEGQNAILECKTASQYNAKLWSEEGGTNLPEEYILQCAHYAEVCDVDVVYVAVLIGGNDFRIYNYNRDKNLGAQIIRAESNFWHNHVLAKVEPDPTTLANIAMAWPDATESIFTTASDDLVNDVQEAADIKKQIALLEKEYKDKILPIQKAMQDSASLQDSLGNTLVTWKNQETTRFDAKKLKEADVDLYNQYAYTTKTRIFKIKGE